MPERPTRRCLVLGGAGFIGSHLVERRIAAGDHVTVIDSFEYCYSDNLEALDGHPHLEVLRADVSEPGWSVPGDFDDLYHLAGVVATGEFMRRPVAALWTSLRPMEALLRYRRDRNRKARLLFASSSEVYGDAQVHPQPEGYRGHVSCTGPRSGYDEGKRATESLITGWAREHDEPCAAAVVRLFNTYGPRMTANGRLVPSMVVDALQSGEITVNRPGTQTRTLLDVRDALVAIERALERQHPVPINIGGFETMPVRETAERIAAAVLDITGREVRLTDGPEIPDEVLRRRPDLARAKELLDWAPSTPFSAGVREVIRYWQGRTEPAREEDAEESLPIPSGGERPQA
ncbi:MAG: GDP-mannose 4,6-dehydratase [Planctomycetota bacterium]